MLQPTVLKLLQASCSSSSFFVSKSSIGHKTFWKYEGADAIVFNEVWLELHLPLSKHLGPAAVTLPRAHFKKLAGTLFPGLSEIRSRLLFPIMCFSLLNPFPRRLY